MSSSETGADVVVVTGAAGAMGSEVAAHLAGIGKRVIAADVQDPSVVVGKIAADGHVAVGVDLDVTSRESWDAVVALTVEKFGRIDALVNVAATVTDGPDTIFDVDPVEWRRVIDVNIIGLAIGMSRVANHMRGNGSGRIVNVSSVSGLLGNHKCAVYSASKGGLIALTLQAAVDLAQVGVTVNSIAPGMMEKSMLGRSADTEARRKLLQRVPINRPVREMEIARAVEYFLAPDAGIVTGQVLSVDGGWSSSLRNGRGD